MTDHGPTNEEREALIAGDRAGALEPDEAADLALMASLLADPSTWVEPSPDLEDAVVRAVIAADRTPSASPVPAAHPAVRKQAPRRRRILTSSIAAAASVAIVLGAFVATEGGTSADFSARLSATALAPSAAASVSIAHTAAGFRVSLDPRGLPALPDGQYYQAWLKNAGGVLVPIGTFSSSGGRVTLWSGVSPKDFPAMSVTIESQDNDQGSSGLRVLIGVVHAN